MREIWRVYVLTILGVVGTLVLALGIAFFDQSLVGMLI
jgi:hypothetical protein